MKNLFVFPALTLLLTSMPALTVGHWTYDRLIVNGSVVGTPYEYVRKSSNGNSPLQNVNSTDMRCNTGGSEGANTSTYTVRAGDELGFGIAETFGHPGVQQVYLSRAPGLAAEYDGSGDWAKIYTLTYSLNASYGAGDGILKWATHRALTFRFVLPSSTPAGEYLLRAEGLALHAAHKPDCAQFYVGCAQIRVIGSDGGSGNGSGSESGSGSGKGFGPTIKFPGGYQWNSPGVLIPEFWSKITNYTSPGPKLWPEGTVEQHVLVGTKK